MTEQLKDVVDMVGQAIEAAGVLAIVVAVVWSTARFAFGAREDAYAHYRRRLGRGLLLGLELLVAGDIIRTVTAEPTLRQVAVLGVIVLVRTFLSLSIEVEIEGRFPWQKS